MKTTKIEIITIGDEILIGQIVDTNSAWMAAEINRAGYEVAQITSVHDNENQIAEALDAALQRAETVLITGGLGPTNDDITKQTLCRYFNTKLVYSQAVADNIEVLLQNRKRAMNALTATQAMVPENCTVIQNPVGTAPVMWFEREGKIVVSMPGVPCEMKNAMSNEIIPRLKQKFNSQKILHKTVIVSGLPESALALKIAAWENALPANLHLAYLPAAGIVKLRLSGVSDDMFSLEFAINQQFATLSGILGNAIVAYDDLPVEVIAANLLKKNDKTLSTAESCTGGNIAHLLTTVPKISKYFVGSVVAYSNSVKTNLLAVKSEDIETFGAVSKPVVEQMALGARALFGSDYAVAVSGIAGPDGGSDEKPVGTVWIAVCSAEKTISRLYNFGNDRIQNIERATQAALLLLKEL
jgi:nicotinamide-nucleotide amidase